MTARPPPNLATNSSNAFELASGEDAQIDIAEDDQVVFEELLSIFGEFFE